MIDRAEIVVKAGDGGDGAVSFRREKFIPFGGPDGGDGGSGGDGIIEADASVSSLRKFTQKIFYRAADGKGGMAKKKHGRRGRDLVLTVPVGTVVLDKARAGEDALIADLGQPGQRVVVSGGGKGGWGNTHFTSSTHQAPQIAQKGETGEERSIILEMKLIADVGIIGYPNVGKSTLIAAVSAARPKIAGYSFTTRQPVLGVVDVNQQIFVVAEIPGLIDGAHLGRGLGHDFLRHVARTKVLIHLVDGSSATPLEDMIKVNAELGLFDSALAQKPQLLVVNKIDIPQVRARIDEIKDAFNSAGIKALFISAALGEGITELTTATLEMLSQVATREEAGGRIPWMVFRPQPRDTGASVHKEGDTFVVVAPELERIITGVDTTSAEVRWQLQRQLIRLGLVKALERAGVQPGDSVRCGNLEWEW